MTNPLPAAGLSPGAERRDYARQRRAGILKGIKDGIVQSAAYKIVKRMLWGHIA